jgi:soluble lytic murein transglycosylase
MLYNHNVTEAARVIPLIPTHLRKSYQQRIDQQSGKKIAFVLNKNHKTDIGILYNLAHTHELNKDEDNLINTLHIASTQDKSVQMYFWRLKAKLIRTLIQRKQYKMAYLFASSHGHSNLKEYSEAEWLSGWIALRYLKEPNTAITHFNNFYSKVKMPISLSRGAYWLGRSYETLGQISKSKDWYSVAAKYYTSFYGQLSICKINNCQINLPKSAKASLASIKKFNNNPLIKAALLLDTSDKYRHLTKELLLRAIDESIDKEEITLISKIKFKDNNDHLATEMAKQAAYKNVVILESNYPFPNYIYSKHNIDHTLVLSLIRQESVFNHKAVSSAGAMGLMQLMPFVAKKTAAQLKLKYDQNKLLSDPKFNTRLGSSHIELLLNEYNNSYILSIAAYNAGSKAVDTWITDNGDPRLMKSEEDIIDWIEKISFHETRNYVQRVLENRAIYYCMINKRNQLPDILKPKNK